MAAVNRVAKPVKNINQSERNLCTAVTASSSSQSLSDVVKSKFVNAPGVGRLRKATSYQNLKTPASNKGSSTSSLSVASSSNGSRIFKRPHPVREKLHGSTTNLPDDVCSKPKLSSNGSVRPISHSHLNNGCNVTSNQKSRCNAHRISVNSDLLSRVEKEKKQYEARISELTQVTENRKMEIEKLSFELRRTKEELVKLQSTYENVKQTMLLAKQNGSDESSKSIADNGGHRLVDGNQKLVGCSSSISVFRKPASVPCSPPESLATTTRLTPGGVTTTHTGSLSGDWMDGPLSLEMSVPSDYRAMMNQSNIDPHSTTLSDLKVKSRCESVASLHGRLLQMEEANHTTNEELQATLQELWDLQRGVDEAYEEVHSLSFERGILLEALSTQTTKLEHCRFQIEQLKHLLLTDRRAQTTETRENHFCELYASIEQEKLVLLGQNNDLAQSSDDLAKKCRILTEKASQLQDAYDNLENEHSALKTVYQSVYSELNALKAMGDEEGTMQQHMLINSEWHPSSLNELNFPSPDKPCPICSATGITELQGRVAELEKELSNSQEGVELLRAERECESTEWRLYERDLLKTVQVADSIKTEAEAKAVRFNDENESLKDQVEKLTRESKNLSKQLSSLKDTLSTFSASHTSPTKKTAVSTITEDSLLLNEVSGEQNKSTVKNTLVNNPAQRLHNANGSLSDASFTIRNTTNVHNQFVHSRPSTFNHYGSYSTSPGAPIRPSCLTNGPTVRSLIQSIESQVKAVQHQKRGLASATPNSLSNAKGSPSFRLFSHNTCPNTSPTPAGANTARPNMSMSPNKVSVIKQKLRSSGVANCPSPTFNRPKENASAPGGPESGPPPSSSSKRETDSMEGCPRPRTNSAVVIRSNTLDSSVRPQSAEKRCHMSVESDSNKDALFSSSRLPNSMHSSDLCPSIDHNHTTNTLHVSLDHSSSSPLNNSRCSTTTKSVGGGENSMQPTTKDPPDTTDTNSSFVGVNAVCHDPLLELARRTQAGSKRNALLLWCQSRLLNYRGVEVTNFSSSWKNGLAFCALLHTYMPSEIPWDDLVTTNGLPVDTKRCLDVVFKAAENAGIPSTLRPHDLLTTDRPDWNSVLSYVTAIYMHYELSSTAPTSTGKATGSRNSIVPELVNP